MDSSDERAKSQFMDGEGFTQPSKTAKVVQIPKETPTSTKNRYETLEGATAVAGPSGVSGYLAINQKTARRRT